jgi:hypothetical protein
MKKLERNKKFNVKNISGGRIVAGAISIPHLQERVIDPYRVSEEELLKLDIFLSRGHIEISYELPVEEDEEYSVKQVETAKNDRGEKNSHTVFDPTAEKKKGIFSVENHDTSKSVQSEQLDNQSKAVEVEYSEVDRIEAVEFLSKHWKKVESEVGQIKSLRKLLFLLKVAKEENVANKKVEIIDSKLKELEE